MRLQENPSLLQQLAWKQGRQCCNLSGSASAVLILFQKGCQVWKSYQVFQGTTCDKTENHSALLYCLFLPCAKPGSRGPTCLKLSLTLSGFRIVTE